MKKQHKWSSNDDERLKNAVEECRPLFEHFEEQNKSYTKLNAWDAVAGRLLPGICVTGAACMRRWEVLREQSRDTWGTTIEMVEKYERELAEETFDVLAKVLKGVEITNERLDKIETQLSSIERLWE